MRGQFLRPGQGLDGRDALPDPLGWKRVSTEMSLYVLAYNLKRMVSILGIGPLLEVIRA
jgi:hypothetical protein